MRQYIGTKIIEAEPAVRVDGEIQDPTWPIGIESVVVEGYRVRYQDGYERWSPKDMFEAAYQPTDGAPFGMALEAMKLGKGARLPHWGPDVAIRAQYPDEHSKMTAPYLYVDSRFGRVPWKETMIELFSNDWEIVD